MIWTENDLAGVKVSVFNNIYGIKPLEISLGLWLKACTLAPAENKHRDLVEELRSNGSSVIKKQLPAVCPGALLRTRRKSVPASERIISLTGVMQIDIDLKDNPHITNPEALRNQLAKIVYVAHASLSVSGKGVWGLIKVRDPERYREHNEQLKTDFASRGILLDSSKGGNPTDLRIYSYDPDAYTAKEFKVYDRLPLPVQSKRRKRSGRSDSKTERKVNSLLSQITANGVNLAPEYKDYLRMAYALISEFGEAGRGYFHSAVCHSPKYNEKDADRLYTNCMKSNGNGVTIASFFYQCKELGISYQPEKSATFEEIIIKNTKTVKG